MASRASTELRVKNGMVEIGALARHVALERSSDIAKHAPLIALAMPHIAHPAIRNRGTIGGSLAYADPAAELPACLVALDGEIDIAGPKGKRSVKAGDFFKGLFETALGPHDVLRRSACRLRQRTRGSASRSWRAGMATTRMVGLAAAAKANGKALSDVRLVLLRRRRNAGARPQGRGGARCRLGRRGGRGARSRSGRRHPGDRCGEEASRRRAAAARRRSSSWSRAHEHARHPLTVNGEAVAESVEPRTTLVDFLRETLGLTGSHVGCEHGVCGACTVLLNGTIVRGCLTLAVQCDGATGRNHRGRVGFRRDRRPAGGFPPPQRAAMRLLHPAMLLTAQELLARGGIPSRDTIREHLAGNYCRCTGYQAIVDAIESVAQARAKG